MKTLIILLTLSIAFSMLGSITAIKTNKIKLPIVFTSISLIFLVIALMYGWYNIEIIPSKIK